MNLTEVATTTTAHDTLQVVLFSLGRRRLGVEARFVRSSSLAPHDADGEAAARLGLDATDALPRVSYSLILKRPDGDRPVLVDGPVELAEIPAAAIHPLPPLLAARCRLHGLRALVVQAQRSETPAIPLVDVNALGVDLPGHPSP
ncbi:MAG: hypothetical protein BWK76_05060 [Desulfobulbaceae bacterium A2]|nr:MAG: hypothetical protein BWK76_05060 [Desulfobulbaceae bacterium A2]